MDAFKIFCDTHDLKVNLGKTKVMIFNTSQPAMHQEQFLFAIDPVEIVDSYTYLGVVFSGPIFTMRPTMQARISRGYAALAKLEQQCYHSHFQDPWTKSLLFDSLVRPASMYGSPWWGADLSDTEWARVKPLQILMFARMIRSKPSVPHQIILAKFNTSPLQLDAAFQAITYLHKVRDFNFSFNGSTLANPILLYGLIH